MPDFRRLEGQAPFMLLAGNINVVGFSFFPPYFIQLHVLKGLIRAGMINASPHITTAMTVEPVDNRASRIILREGTVRGKGMKRVNSGQ